MKIQTQANASLAHVAELIADIPIAMLTNVDADGALASRPMAPLEMDDSGALWFFTNLNSSKIDHLRIANLSFTDTGRGTYVSLSGRGEITADRSHVHRLWTADAKPWFPDGPDSSELVLLKFMPASADYWDTPSSSMVRAFASIAAVLTGKSVAMGEQGSYSGLTSSPSATGAPS